MTGLRIASTSLLSLDSLSPPVSASAVGSALLTVRLRRISNLNSTPRQELRFPLIDTSGSSKMSGAADVRVEGSQGDGLQLSTERFDGTSPVPP